MSAVRCMALGLVMTGLVFQAKAYPDAEKAPELPSFRITTQAGKRTMTAIPDKVQADKLTFDGYGKPCANNVAGPRWAAAVGDEILAAFECPAANDGGVDSVIARFAKGNTNTPVCFGQVGLMRDSSYYYYGRIKTIQPRSLLDQNLILAITMHGGDAGVNWQAYAFVHLDQECRATVLAKFYDSLEHDHDVDTSCKGSHRMYRFTSDTTVEVDRFKVTRCRKSEPVLDVREGTRKLDLQELLSQPKLRITKP